MILWLWVWASAQVAQPDERYYLIGDLAGRKIQMDISRTGTELSGHYYYEDFGTPLWLQGKVEAKDETSDSLWLLEEYLQDESQSQSSGRFELQHVVPWYSEDPEARAHFLGRWYSPEGDREYEVKLEQAAEHSQLTIRFADSFDVSSTYPFFRYEPWQGLNPVFQEVFQQNVAFFHEGQSYLLEDHPPIGWGLYENVGIVYLSDKVVSILDDLWMFTGGAHGNTGFISYNYRQINGMWQPFGLGDLFQENSDYLKALESYILADLSKQEAAWVLDGSLNALTLEDLSVFSLKPSGLDFHFAPYFAGPYVQGIFTVTVPKEVLAPFLREDSPF
ncbi:MAG: DUF3298 domain-containing protein [Deinococcales bacterium]